MKREILCDECGRLPQRSSYDVFWLEQGSAKSKYFCDRCNAMIDKGDGCYAVSQWFTGRGIPYYAWEHEYIDIAGGDK